MDPLFCSSSPFPFTTASLGVLLGSLPQLGPSHLCHFCQSFVPCLHINYELLEEQKTSWGRLKKNKTTTTGQGPGKLHKKCLIVSYATIPVPHTFRLKATLLGTQKWVFLFGNNSRRASEATVKLLRSRCFFLSPINLHLHLPSSIPALAHLLNGTRHSSLFFWLTQRTRNVSAEATAPSPRGWVRKENMKHWNTSEENNNILLKDSLVSSTFGGSYS